MRRSHFTIGQALSRSCQFARRRRQPARVDIERGADGLNAACFASGRGSRSSFLSAGTFALSARLPRRKPPELGPLADSVRFKFQVSQRSHRSRVRMTQKKRSRCLLLLESFETNEGSHYAAC